MSNYTEYIAQDGQWVELPGDPNEMVAVGGEWVPSGSTVVDPPEEVSSLAAVPNLTMLMDTRTMGDVDDQVMTWTDPISSKQFTSGGTAGTSPTIRQDPNGRKFLRFNGAYNRLTHDGNVMPTTGGVTIYALVRMAAANMGMVFHQGSTTSLNKGFMLSCAGANYIRGLRLMDDGLSARGTQGIITDSWQVVSFVSPNASSVEFRTNEQTGAFTAPTGTTTGVMTTNVTSIGAGYSRNADKMGLLSDFAEMDLGAILTCNAAHDAATRTQVEQLLATEFQIQLPSQGGSFHNVTEVRARRLAKSLEYGFLTTHPISGKALAGFHNTGVDPAVTLTPYTGTLKTTQDNQVFEGLRIEGDFRIEHAAPILRNCILYSPIDPKVGGGSKPGGTIATYENCEIMGREEDSSTTVGYNRYTAKNVWVHDSEDGFRLGNDVLVDTCLATRQSHGMINANERLHTDDAQSTGCNNGEGSWTIVRNCTFPSIRDNLSKGNSAFILNNELNYTKNILIEDNWVGNGSYTIFVTAHPYYAANFIIRNNVFRGDALEGEVWLPHADQDGFCTFEGNVRLDGEPMRIYRTTFKTPDTEGRDVRYANGVYLPVLP